jgi:hypothetical protein
MRCSPLRQIIKSAGTGTSFRDSQTAILLKTRMVDPIISRSRIMIRAYLLIAASCFLKIRSFRYHHQCLIKLRLRENAAIAVIMRDPKFSVIPFRKRAAVHADGGHRCKFTQLCQVWLENSPRPGRRSTSWRRMMIRLAGVCLNSTTQACPRLFHERLSRSSKYLDLDIPAVVGFVRIWVVGTFLGLVLITNGRLIPGLVIIT